MGPVVNICALLVGLAVFAAWTLSQFAVPRRVGWVNLLAMSVLCCLGGISRGKSRTEC